MTAGNITSFNVVAQSTTVGDYPATYEFKLTPNGEVPRYGTVKLTLPSQI